MPLHFEDKVEIQELSSRYANALDEGNMEEWLDTWAENGVWEGALGRYEGKESLAKLPGDLGARIQNKRHTMTNFVITGDGIEATQKCYMLIFERESAPVLVATGVYTDTLSKIEGRWKFAHRAVKLDPSFTKRL